MKATLRYAEQFAVSVANNSAPFEYVFRANSIYDPNYTSTGHQPLGHDQLAALYGAYQVTQSRIRLNYATNSGINDTVTCVLRVDDDATFLNATSGELEQADAVWVSQQGRLELPPINLVTSFNPQSYFGKRYDLADTVALFGTNPAAEAYYHILVAQSGSSATSGVCTVVIEYDVVCTQPKELSQS